MLSPSIFSFLSILPPYLKRENAKEGVYLFNYIR